MHVTFYLHQSALFRLCSIFLKKTKKTATTKTTVRQISTSKTNQKNKTNQALLAFQFLFTPGSPKPLKKKKKTEVSSDLCRGYCALTTVEET